MLINQLAVLGVGLIGGSLARILRQKGICKNFIGYGRNETNLIRAVELGVIDRFSQDITEVIRDADVIVLATPLSTTEGLLLQMRDSIKPGAIITDVGSAKGSVAEAARKLLNTEQLKYFVPGHPIAGTEKSGVEASFAELFEDHLVILTPLDESDQQAVELISQMWRSAGAKLVQMDISHHDEVLAATSHLPHMLAYSLVDCLAGMQERDEIFTYAAGGFSDFTRIASSSPEMWNDVCFANRRNLVKMLDLFGTHLAEIKMAIEKGDNRSLLEIFTRAKQVRDEFVSQRSSTINTSE